MTLALTPSVSTIGLAPDTLDSGTVAPDVTLDVSHDDVIVDDVTIDEEPVGTSFARCSDGHGTLSHLFFSDDDHDLARAKAICGPCGLRESCLSGAVERGEPYGVWGGMLVLDGVPVEFKRKRGRPRKVPLPVLVVDEVPLPPHLVA